MANVIRREKGTPQGGVISPLLANLFLHYAFDKWMRKLYPGLCFERYADDILVHCRSKAEAERILKVIEERLAECKLSVNREKTKIVYCGFAKFYDEYPHRSFDFLGYSFRRKLTRAKTGKQFVGFVPAISQVEYYLKRWVRNKFRAKCHLAKMERALNYLGRVRKYKPYLFEHWRYGWGSPLVE